MFVVLRHRKCQLRRREFVNTVMLINRYDYDGTYIIFCLFVCVCIRLEYLDWHIAVDSTAWRYYTQEFCGMISMIATAFNVLQQMEPYSDFHKRTNERTNEWMKPTTFVFNWHISVFNKIALIIVPICHSGSTATAAKCIPTIQQQKNQSISFWLHWTHWNRFFPRSFFFLECNVRFITSHCQH